MTYKDWQDVKLFIKTILLLWLNMLGTSHAKNWLAPIRSRCNSLLNGAYTQFFISFPALPWIHLQQAFLLAKLGANALTWKRRIEKQNWSLEARLNLPYCTWETIIYSRYKYIIFYPRFWNSLPGVHLNFVSDLWLLFILQASVFFLARNPLHKHIETHD
jgi:hypothetical protein